MHKHSKWKSLDPRPRHGVSQESFAIGIKNLLKNRNMLRWNFIVLFIFLENTPNSAFYMIYEKLQLELKIICYSEDNIAQIC